MKVVRSFIFILFILTPFLVKAQIKFEAKTEKSSYALNEKIQLAFTINVDADDFVPPVFDNFAEQGPFIGVYQYADSNGKRVFEKSYKYFLTPKKQGTFVIKEAQMVFNGKVYKSLPIKITITKALPTPRNTNGPDDRYGEGVFLISEISDRSPFVNQPIKVTYKLFFDQRFTIRNISNMKKPKYNKFWGEFVQEQRPNAVEAQYNGRSYAMVVLGTATLYPLEAGNLNIEPFTFDANVEYPSNQRDIFGDPIYAVGQKSLSSSNQSVTVKNLPETGKPETFTGATGTFSFSVTPSKTSLKHGESLSLVVKVSGTGNLKLFSLPKPEVPTALEIFDPQHSENISTPSSGMTGNISDTYTIVPQYKGKYPIKPISFSYFDVQTGKYKTITSPEIMIDVIDGPTEKLENVVSKDGKSKNENNLVFANIKLKTKLISSKKKDFFGTTKYYVLQIIPFLFIPFIILYRKRKEANDNDITGNRTKQNNKLAKKYLTQAKKQFNNKEQFYIALEKAMHNFLKAKLKIETSEMSKNNISELLLTRNANEETVSEFITLTENCEFARYAPSASGAIQNDYLKAVEIISDLEKQLDN